MEKIRIKEGFVLRDVAGQAIVIAVGEASKRFHGMINLNSTARFIWKKIEAGDNVGKIVEDMVEQYDVAFEKAAVDVENMVTKMIDADIFEKIEE